MSSLITLGAPVLTDSQAATPLTAFSSIAVIASMSDVALTLGAVAAGSLTMPYAGRIIGCVREQDAALGAGSLTIKFFVNGVADATTISVLPASAIRGKHILSPSISFAVDDRIDIRISTDAAITVVTRIIVVPLVTFNS